MTTTPASGFPSESLMLPETFTACAKEVRQIKEAVMNTKNLFITLPLYQNEAETPTINILVIGYEP